MKEQVLDRLARLLKYFKGLEHENNEKEYAYILKGTINGITYSIKNLEDFFETEIKMIAEGEKITQKIKPCPFCGGEGRLQAVITESRINQDDYFVKCRECGASTMKYFSKQKEAIAAWNRRNGD